ATPHVLLFKANNAFADGRFDFTLGFHCGLEGLTRWVRSKWLATCYLWRFIENYILKGALFNLQLEHDRLQ
ncbi:MAG TPA: hypothetical protein VGZ25_15040, partial [Gemmataceae bacterium]|nr:hypothetical protein [Gemmataceae bacterium]